MPRPIELEVWRGDELVGAQILSQNVIKIGRLPSSHVHLQSDDVARMHAVIEVADRGLRVVDLGSPMGTALNGQSIEKSASVSVGDSIAVGEYCVKVRAAPVQNGGAAVAQRPSGLISADEHEHTHAPEHAEVVTMFGNTVLDVQHVKREHKRRSGLPWLALGGLMVLGGAGWFASQTALRAEAWSAHQTAKAEAAIAGQPAPQAPFSWGSLGAALGLLGLVPFGVGLTRQRDRETSSYTIGEGPEASFATPADALPSPTAFPLVRQDADGQARVRFTADMEGDVTIEGEQHRLEALIESGQATAEGASFSLPLRAGARCRIRHGGLTFFVNSVAPGKVVAKRAETDKPFWLYNAASLLAVGTLLGLAHLAMPNQGDFSLGDEVSVNRFVGYIQQPDERDEPEEPTSSDEDESGEPSTEGARAPGAEGEMGNPDRKPSTPKRFAMKGPKDAPVQMSRNFSPDVAARQAGILGMIQQDSGHFLASPSGGAFSMGNDDDDLWGNLTGTDVGESHGAGGLALMGRGKGGGGDASGVLGLGRVGTIGGRGGYGTCDNCGGGGRGAGFGRRGKRTPKPRIGKGEVRGALDKDIVRRVIRSHINQVRHCYNEGLVGDPSLRGRVSVQFSINGKGKVPMAVVAETSVKDPNVGRCIAKAVRRWKFPQPQGNGTVMVTYPFVLNPG